LEFRFFLWYTTVAQNYIKQAYEHLLPWEAILQGLDLACNFYVWCGYNVKSYLNKIKYSPILRDIGQWKK